MNATNWDETISLDSIVMPDASADWIAHVVERDPAHANESGFNAVDFVIDRDDHVLAEVLAGRGFTIVKDELVDAGADRIKIAYSQIHQVARTLYTNVGFSSTRQCAVVSRTS